MIGRAGLERDLLIVVCAISAGIHAALASEHFADGAAAGVGFAGSAAALAALAVALTRGASVVLAAAAAFVLACLIASYGLTITVGVPLVHPEREAVDGLALITKAIEAAGLLAALDLAVPRLKGMLA